MNSVRLALAAGFLAASACGSAAFAQNAEEAQISQAVLTQLKRSPALAGDHLHVETVGHTVYLSGLVDSEVERANAERIARSVAQVDQVVSLLADGNL